MSDSGSDLEETVGATQRWTQRGSESTSTSAYESKSGSNFLENRKMTVDELQSCRENRISIHPKQSSASSFNGRSQSSDDEVTGNKGIVSPTPAKRARSQNVMQPTSTCANVMQPTSTCAYESEHRELGSDITSTNTAKIRHLLLMPWDLVRLMAFFAPEV